jgi:hypothetical protein
MEVESNSRNPYTPLPRIPAVQLHPRVVDGVVSHGKGVDGRPQPPPGPLPDVRMCLTRDHKRHEEAHLGRDDSGSAEVCLIADVGEDENYE